jgi:hypothetical protein
MTSIANGQNATASSSSAGTDASRGSGATVCIFSLDIDSLIHLIDKDIEYNTTERIKSEAAGKEYKDDIRWARTRLRGRLATDKGHMKVVGHFGPRTPSRNLGAFVFPSGVKLVSNRGDRMNRSSSNNTNLLGGLGLVGDDGVEDIPTPDATWHSFVITEGDGSYLYGHCVIRWCRLKLPEETTVDTDVYFQPMAFCLTTKRKQHQAISSLFRDLVLQDSATKPLPRYSDSSSWQNDIVSWARAHGQRVQQGFVSKLGSRLRLIDRQGSREVNKALFRTTRQESEDLGDEYVDLAAAVRKVSGLERKSSDNILQSTLEDLDTKNMRLNVDPPPLDIDMEVLFHRLEPCNILRIMRAMLNEERVVFQSDDVRILLPCCETMVSLLYPFRWPHIYVPVLPIDIAEVSYGAYFDCPGAYLYGVEKTILSRVGRLDDTVVQVDLDANTVWGGDETRSPELPFRLLLRLYAGMLEHGATANFSYDALAVPTYPQSISNTTQLLTDRAIGELGGEEDEEVAPYSAPKEECLGRTIVRRISEVAETLRKRTNSGGKRASLVKRVSSGGKSFSRKWNSSHEVLVGDAVDSSGNDEGKSLVLAFQRAKKSEVSPIFQQKRIRASFMGFMVSCFKAYGMYFTLQGGRFDREAFIGVEGGDEQSQQFFKSFLGTQMFSCFVYSMESRLEKSPFANRAFQKMERKLHVWNHFSRKGFGSLVCVERHRAVLGSQWERRYMLIDLKAGELKIYAYSLLVNILNYVINEKNLEDRNHTGKFDSWVVASPEALVAEQTPAINKYATGYSLEELKSLRAQSLRLEKSYSVHDYMITCSIPPEDGLADGAVRFCIDLEKCESSEVVQNGAAAGQHGGFLKKLFGQHKSPIRYVCSVDSAEVRRSWVKRLLWLSKYCDMPRLAEVYARNDSPCDSQKDMVEHCRRHQCELQDQFCNIPRESRQDSVHIIRERMMDANILTK